MRDNTENLYSSKLENLEEMNKFLDIYEHPKLNPEDSNHLSILVTHSEIGAAIKTLQNTKVQDLMDSLQNSTTPLKKN
jgi:hypothetical protein